jgi:asparagine synthase (glutamine-hydrolysing)
MAHALEIRVPLIDHRVIEIVARTADSIVTAGSHKALLRDALPTALPDSIVFRRKMGFTFPFETWIRTAWKPMIEATLRKPPTFLRRESVMRVWDEFLRGRLHWSRPWSLYVLIRWMEERQPSRSGLHDGG